MRREDRYRFITILLCIIVFGIATFNMGKTYGYNNGYFSGYDDGNNTGARIAYNQGKTIGYNQGLSFRNYYIKDVTDYIVRPDVSKQFATTVADCRRADEVSKVWSETASMFPTITYFDSMKLIRVKDSENMNIGQIYSRSLKLKANESQADIVHRLVDCADYPTCTQLIFKGDNNLFRDDAVNRSDYTFSRVIGLEYGDSSSYYSKVRGK